MKRNFLFGILIGILLSAATFSVRQHYDTPTRAEPISRRPQKGEGEAPDQWLLPKNFTPSSLYTCKEAIFVLEAPDTISIHPEGSGDISAFHRSFETKGTSLSAEDAKVILKTLHAANAYTLPTACGFQPDVLFRLKRDDQQLDLFLCLTCEEIIWRSEPRGQQTEICIGLSKIGANSLRSVLQRVFPKESGAEALQAKLGQP